MPSLSQHSRICQTLGFGTASSHMNEEVLGKVKKDDKEMW